MVESERIFQAYCTLLDEEVEVVARWRPEAPKRAGVPKGWVVDDCLCRADTCPFTACLFAGGGSLWPFGEMRRDARHEVGHEGDDVVSGGTDDCAADRDEGAPGLRGGGGGGPVSGGLGGDGA